MFLCLNSDKKMNEYIDNVLKLAENEGTLDYFKIEMKNNKGQLHLESTIQNSPRVY
ncbi:hypothetical protein [Gottschalkia acidurici]|nr:hypothetical protein [Gottschalkia acidurici]